MELASRSSSNHLSQNHFPTHQTPLPHHPISSGNNFSWDNHQNSHHTTKNSTLTISLPHPYFDLNTARQRSATTKNSLEDDQKDQQLIFLLFSPTTTKRLFLATPKQSQMDRTPSVLKYPNHSFQNTNGLETLNHCRSTLLYLLSGRKMCNFGEPCYNSHN